MIGVFGVIVQLLSSGGYSSGAVFFFIMWGFCQREEVLNCLVLPSWGVCLSKGVAVGRGESAKTFTVACLFAGMGGFAAGFLRAGFKVLWANDIDKHAIASFRENYASQVPAIIHKDVRSLSVAGDGLAPVDVLTAGFPCQSFSISGDRKGFDDERGERFYDIIRIIEEFGDNRPKILLLENVPHLQGGGSGAWFEKIIHAVQDAGYWFDRNSCEILNTCEVSGIPQNRKRLFMVGTSMFHYKHNGFCFPAPSGKPLGLSQFINKTQKAGDENYLDVENKYYRMINDAVLKGDASNIFQLRRYEVREKVGICPTLTANMGGGGHNVPFVVDQWGIRRLLIDECATMQGFDGYLFPDSVPVNERYRQIGNAVSVPVAEKLADSCKSVLFSQS